MLQYVIVECRYAIYRIAEIKSIDRHIANVCYLHIFKWRCTGPHIVWT